MYDHFKMTSANIEEVPHFKIVMLGNSGVGKTAMVSRISEDVFSEQHVPTVGAQFVAMNMNVNGNNCVLELWDTAGQEVFRSLVGFYIRESKGAFILCDVTDAESFDVLPKWVSFINENSAGTQIIIFANKIDKADERVVNTTVLQEFANSCDVKFIEGSAKTGEGIRDAFELMADFVWSASHTSDQIAIDTNDVNISGPAPQKKKCCK